MKNITLKNQTQQRLKRVAEQTGMPEADIVDRALDVFLITEQLGGLKELAEDINYWQQRYFDTLALQTPPTHGLRLCIIKPTGFSRPFRECHHCFLRYYRPFHRKKANLLNDALA